jgi:hypothetical protein
MEIQESGKPWRAATESFEAWFWIQLGISDFPNGNFSRWPTLHLDYGSTDRNLMDQVFRPGSPASGSRSNLEHISHRPAPIA